jgi:rhodanese-related sulfurtransferase
VEQVLSSTAPTDLYVRLVTAGAPIVLDVRRRADLARADEIIVSAIHPAPDAVEAWSGELPRDRQIVVHCVHGREISRNAHQSQQALVQHV